ncbi:MAG: hypothetical protein J6N95_04990, partial [Bacilli bacterium]|nr:hypothetical protein [Bacilli bacterium]
MSPKSVFNATVCLLGFLILLVHTFNIFIKKERRKDENALLIFFLFTMFHFASYFTFVIVKEHYTSDPFIMTVYTIFYVMNNVEVFLFYGYLSSYTEVPVKTRKVADIINISLFVTFVASDIINIFSRVYFTSVDGIYTRNSLMILSQGYQFVMLALSFILVIINKSLNKREKAAFHIYCLLPLVAIIVQNILAGYAIAYVSLLLAIEILFVFLNVEKNIKLKEEQEKLKDA